MQIEATEAYARQRDAQDGLARFRQEFYRSPDTLYMDGNSLGLLSVRAEESLLRVLNQWKTLAIDGWMQAEPPWLSFAEELARCIAPLLGAQPDEVIITNSTTVNLHQLLATLYRTNDQRPTTNAEAQPGPRVKIVTDATAFPSDFYAIESHLRMRGRNPATDLKIVPSRNGYTLDEAEIFAAMTEDVQIAFLPAVIYTSGQLLDMAALTAEAHRRGILIGFDCSHSVGIIPHSLTAWGVDFAFWCSYKYLNGGPGATGGLYLNRRHLDRLPGLAGWFGSRKEAQFNMASEMEPAEGASRLQIGTPNLLSMAPLLGALEMMEEAGIAQIRTKSLALTAYLRALAEAELAAFGFTFATPHEDARRGGHVALIHPEAVRIGKALKAARVVPDFRPPCIVRLAPVPLYTSFQDCFEAVRRLRGIMERRQYEDYAKERELVA